MITKKLKTEYVRTKLSTNSTWALRCLTVIYNNQTNTEKCTGTTHVDNGIGFTGTDSFILSSFAEQYKKRGWLSPKQMNILFKKAKKYHKQVLKVTDDKKLVECMYRDNVVTKEDVENYEIKNFIEEI